LSQPIKDAIGSFIGRVVALCVTRAWGTIIFALVITIAASFHLATNLKINTDNEDMLSEELQFRQNAIAIDRAFPQLDDTMLIALEAENSDIVDEKTITLVDALKQQGSIFEEVFSPASDPFFRENGLLFLDVEELDDLYLRLAAAQPFLGTLWQQPNLAGLSDITELIADATDLDNANLSEAGRVFSKMAEVIQAVRADEAKQLVWSEVLLGREKSDGLQYRLISVKPKLDYASLQPAARAKDVIYQTATELGLEKSGVSVSLTGGAVLQDDELKSVERGMGLAGIISLVVVTLVLCIGLRSIGMMVALLFTLVIGLIWTAAIAIIWVGEFNLISVAFAVLFVGLSVDFGIHFSLRSSEFVKQQGDWLRALSDGAKSVGPSLLFCAITTSIAFFSFLPTSYQGLAELGLIAGIGMFVALVTNLTVLPALLRIFVRRAPRHHTAISDGATERRSKKTAGIVLAVATISLAVSLWVAKDVRFDFDPMNLRDPDASSMRTLFDLADAGKIEPYTADLLVSDISRLPEIRRQLEAVESVERVESVDDLIPIKQSDKFAIIDDIGLIIGPSFFAPQGNINTPIEQLIAAAQNLEINLSKLQGDEILGGPAQELLSVLSELSLDQLPLVNQALFNGLPSQLSRLNESLQPSEIALRTLPDHLRNRFVSPDGIFRLEIVPVADLRNPKSMEDFARDVQAVAPNATGGLIIVVEAGKAVLDAFLDALIYSIIGIGIFLLITLRRLLDVLLVFAPVAVASVWVLAVSALFDLPFNFANVIVLPLIFGLSVDFGLHLIIRARDREGGISALKTTTPRAILISALTTLGSFGSIMLSGHPGTASMGILLTIAIILSMIAILLVLPALMTLFLRAERVHPD
jgi:hopanoid biosynthesis associated RND transporter like protein HpnN